MAEEDPDLEIIARLTDRMAKGESIDWDHQEEAEAKDPHLLQALRRIDQVIELFPQTWKDQRSPATEKNDRWGNLHLVEKIGEGSYGEVYRAFDPFLKRDVALKLLRNVDAGRLEDEQFIAEARRLAQIRHPNVIAIYGATTQQERSGFWCELLLGPTLEQALATGKTFRWAEILDLAGDLSAAAEAVHDALLVHGDIKAANVMMESRRGAVLLDFGAGIHLDIISISDLSGTRATPLSMAPELFHGSKVNHATDLYALGVLFYRLSTGHYPFQADSFEDLREEVCGEEAPSFDGFRSFPKGWKKLVASLLDPSPCHRPSASTVVGTVRSLKSLPRRRARQTALAAVITLLLILSITASLGYWFSSRAQAKAEQASLTAEAVNELLTDILASPSGTEQGRDVKVIDILSQAEESLANRPNLPQLVRDRVHMTLALTYRGLGEWEEAESRFNNLLETTQNNPKAAESRIQIYESLSWIHDRRGKFESSRSAADGAVAEATLLGNPTLLTGARLTLARAYRKLGQLEEAERELDRVVIVENDREDDILNHSRWLNQMAHLATERHQYELAYSFRKKSERIDREYYGARSERTIIIRNSLACDLGRMGDHQEARKIFEATLELARDFLGDDHPTTLALQQNLGIALKDLGEWQRALVLHYKTLEALEKRHGPNYYLSLNARGDLAELLGKMGRAGEAEDNFRKVIAGNRILYGENHRTVVSREVQLVQLYVRTEQFPEALDVGRSVLDRLSSINGENGGIESLIPELHLSLAHASLSQDRPIQAAEHLRTLTPSLVERLSVEKSVDFFILKAELALREGELEMALNHLNQALEVWGEIDNGPKLFPSLETRIQAVRLLIQ